MRRWALGCMVLLGTAPSTAAQQLDSLPFTSGENADGSRYVWYLYQKVGLRYPYVSAADLPASLAFREVAIDSASVGDVARWPGYIAVYSGDDRGGFYTAEGEVPVDTLLARRGIPRIFRWTVRPYELESRDQVFEVVQGRWGWADGDLTCETNPHTIEFNPGRSLMVITFARDHTPPKDQLVKENRKAYYDIREYGPSFIRGFLHGEKRKTNAGDPVVWDLVLTGPDAYRWHRNDWGPEGFTGEIVRCPPP